MLSHVLLAAAGGNVTWYLLPLAVVVSLVYYASRLEMPEMILRRAARMFVNILLLMGAVLAVLLVLSYRL